MDRPRTPLDLLLDFVCYCIEDVNATCSRCYVQSMLACISVDLHAAHLARHRQYHLFEERVTLVCIFRDVDHVDLTFSICHVEVLAVIISDKVDDALGQVRDVLCYARLWVVFDQLPSRAPKVHMISDKGIVSPHH